MQLLTKYLPDGSVHFGTYKTHFGWMSWASLGEYLEDIPTFVESGGTPMEGEVPAVCAHNGLDGIGMSGTNSGHTLLV